MMSRGVGSDKETPTNSTLEKMSFNVWLAGLSLSYVLTVDGWA